MPKQKPSYLLHKPTGQARVRIDGKDYYLGSFGSPESREHYDDLLAEWLARNGDMRRYTLTVDELCLLFTYHAKTYYRKNGEQTSEVNNIRIALRPLIRLFGKSRVRDFGPLKLKAARNAMIDAGNVRTSINRQIGRIKRMFRWGVENEHVPATVYSALATVSGLGFGRHAVTEADPVKPVPQPFVDAVEPHVSRQVWGMIRLQLLTGMRPGEAMRMRTREVNTTDKVWEYRPESHKTEHHGKSRIVFIGPKAQVVLREFLKTDLDAYLFSPAEARAEYLAQRKASRKTPMSPSQRRRRQKAHPRKRPGLRYTATSYRRAVANACERAKVPVWSPGQLRHNAATTIRRKADIDTARTVLGHSSVAVTEVYAERDASTARRIIGRIG
ncbi:MAG: site-specific integrase [Planctomycetaceae bacterium]